MRRVVIVIGYFAAWFLLSWAIVEAVRPRKQEFDSLPGYAAYRKPVWERIAIR